MTSLVNDAGLFLESQRLAFAMYCDENDLTIEEGRELAKEVGEAVQWTADYRETYARP